MTRDPGAYLDRMTSEPRLDQPDAESEDRPRYPFEIGDRVTGPGVTGEVVDRPGPYTVTVLQEPGRFRLSASTTNLTKQG